MSQDADNPVLAALRARRVVRHMTEQPVSRQLLDLVAGTARWAPNAGNRRIQTLVIVEDPVTIRLLKAVAPGMVPSPQALIVICLDIERARRFGFASDYRGLYVDVGTLAATMLIAAHSIGLGACPVTSFSQAAVSRILDLPEVFCPEMLICLGYPSPTQPATFAPPSHTR